MTMDKKEASMTMDKKKGSMTMDKKKGSMTMDKKEASMTMDKKKASMTMDKKKASMTMEKNTKTFDHSKHRTASASGSYYCAACKISLNSEGQFSQHQLGKKHRQKEPVLEASSNPNKSSKLPNRKSKSLNDPRVTTK